MKEQRARLFIWDVGTNSQTGNDRGPNGVKESREETATLLKSAADVEAEMKAKEQQLRKAWQDCAQEKVAFQNAESAEVLTRKQLGRVHRGMDRNDRSTRAGPWSPPNKKQTLLKEANRTLPAAEQHFDDVGIEGQPENERNDERDQEFLELERSRATKSKETQRLHRIETEFERQKVKEHKLRLCFEKMDDAFRHTTDRLADVQKEMNNIQLGKAGSIAEASYITIQLNQLLEHHQIQEKLLTEAMGRFSVLSANVEKLEGGQERYMVAQSRVQELETMMRKIKRKHASQSSQLAVAEMTVNAMTQILSDLNQASEV